MSSLVDYAQSELDMIEKDEDGIQEMMNKDILEIVEVFSNQGHSGLSASYAIGALERLLRWLPLKPLTGEESEWKESFSWDGDQQNKRCGRVFRRKDGTAYDIEGKIFSRDGGKTWYSSAASFVDVTFPYTPPTFPERVILEEGEDDQVR